jgi:sulfur carrier protein ThiS adenylyltransferase
LTEILSQKHFFIAGAGGLGSNVAMMLVRAGAENLTIIDFDKIEEANINRQFYFRDQVGKIKVEALQENLIRINPDIKLSIKQKKITAENALELIPVNADIILECFDCAASKAMLVTFCLKNFPQKTIISVSGLAGAGKLDSIKVSKGPGKLLIIGDGESEATQETGTLSSRVMFAASMQAHMAISMTQKSSNRT